jgi:transcriptional regulator with XRE-family HTH domain
MPDWQDFEKLVKSVNTEEEYDKLKMGSDFASKLLKARLDKNLTQAELAKRAGLKQSAIARIENQGSLPRIDTVFKIATALGTEIDFVPQNNPKENQIEKLTDRIIELENLIKELTKAVSYLPREYPYLLAIREDSDNGEKP